MKLIPIDPNNLPDNEVLAYSEISGAVTGKLMFNPVIDEVICTGRIKSISGVTHYIPLDQIKPESDKPSLLDALPNGFIIQKYSNRLTVYENDRNFEDGIGYDGQLMIESISDFEQRMIETFQIN